MDKKTKVVALLKKGVTYSQIAEEVGVAKSTISYYAAKVGLKQFSKDDWVDWSAVQKYHDQGKSISECSQKFNFSHSSWNVAKKRGWIKTRQYVQPLDNLLTSGSTRGLGNLKVRLVREGKLKYECNLCHIKRWQNKFLMLQLDHINGDKKDCRLENLRFLCPNCHSQTDTFAGGNTSSGKKKKDNSSYVRDSIKKIIGE